MANGSDDVSGVVLDPQIEARVRESFARQSLMTTIGASLHRVARGVVVIDLHPAAGLCALRPHADGVPGRRLCEGWTSRAAHRDHAGDADLGAGGGCVLTRTGSSYL